MAAVSTKPSATMPSADIIVDDDIVPDDPEEDVEQQDPLKPKSIFGFGYDIEVNEDGTVKHPENVLTKEMIRTGLSHVARTLDTFEFAYSRFEGRSRNLTNIDILGEYIHLRVIDLSGNRIQSAKALAPLQHLLVLVLSDNELASLEEIPELPFLQALNVQGNGLTTTTGLVPNSLAYLQLNFNQLETLDNFNAETFAFLNVLELRGNNLKNLQGLNLPSLVRLFVADNELSSLEGLGGCPKLTHLHARDNKISQLENFPVLEELEYVNLRNNALTRFTQTNNLGNSPNIRTLIAMDNPIAAIDNYKIEMIATNLNLRRLDKEPIMELDLVDGRQLRSGRDKGLVPAATDDPSLATPPVSIMGDYEEEEGEVEHSELPDQEIMGETEEEVEADEPLEKIQPSDTGEGHLKGVDIKK